MSPGAREERGVAEPASSSGRTRPVEGDLPIRPAGPSGAFEPLPQLVGVLVLTSTVDANTTVREVGRTGHDPNQPIGLAGDGPKTPIRRVGTQAGSPLRAGRPGRAAKEGAVLL